VQYYNVIAFLVFCCSITVCDLKQDNSWICSLLDRALLLGSIQFGVKSLQCILPSVSHWFFMLTTYQLPTCYFNNWSLFHCGARKQKCGHSSLRIASSFYKYKQTIRHKAAYFWIIVGWWFSMYIPRSIGLCHCRVSGTAFKLMEQGVVLTTGIGTWFIGWMETTLPTEFPVIITSNTTLVGAKLQFTAVLHNLKPFHEWD